MKQVKVSIGETVYEWYQKQDWGNWVPGRRKSFGRFLGEVLDSVYHRRICFRKGRKYMVDLLEV